jgi:hypothetical protein
MLALDPMESNPILLQNDEACLSRIQRKKNLHVHQKHQKNYILAYFHLIGETV